MTSGNSAAYGGEGNFGLTKRELFAAMAMQGILSSDAVNWDSDDVAKFAVEQADELIKALNNKKGETMTTEEQAAVLCALELGLDTMILERDEEELRTLRRPHMIQQIYLNIELIKKAQQIMRLA